MSIRVHNTLSGRKEDFVPADGSRVRIYVCGVTPYSTTHIGHARPSVFWDVVRRYLEYRGYRVFLVQNFTDVDDKVIAKAQTTGEDPLAVARAYSHEYLELMDRLGVQRADVYPRVSDHIEDVVRVVEGLVDRGAAYARDGNVFFDVTSFPGYGKLSRRTPDDLRAGARVEVDEAKKNPADFALWKRAKPGEPAWPSPWGPGRPGWHIECTAMALKYLGDGFDFHGGGTELVFPHHENEIAQAEAYTGRAPFCRNWLHHEMVNLRGEKMSKSLENFVPLREVLERAPAPAVRLLLLGAHYRKPVDFDFELLEENKRAWRRLSEAAGRLRETLRESGEARPAATGSGPSAAELRPSAAGLRPSAAGSAPAAAATGSSLAAAAAEARRRFEAAMDDDFNTAEALAALFDLARRVNAELAAGAVESSDPGGVRAALEAMEELGAGVLGVLDAGEQVDATGPGGGGAAEVDGLLRLLVEVRDRLRAEKNYGLADHIRDSLIALGYEVQDGPGGTAARRRD